MSRYRRPHTGGDLFLHGQHLSTAQATHRQRGIICAAGGDAFGSGRADYSTRWGLLKRYVSQRVRHRIEEPQSASRHRRAELGLWQRRFWEHQIRDEADYTRHVDYTHYNPVKHGLVRRACDWPHSTFHRFVRLGLYPPDWAGGGIEDAGDEFGEIEE